MRHATDLHGKTFGRLTVLGRAGSSRHGAALWNVRCQCGTEKSVRTDLLTRGAVVSCGCYRNEVAGSGTAMHGMTGTFEHNSWTAMWKRCTYEKHPRYHRYGGRGIKVCARWRDFVLFLLDMGPCPYERGSIERLDNNKGYRPDNCVWLPKSEQSKNRTY